MRSYKVRELDVKYLEYSGFVKIEDFYKNECIKLPIRDLDEFINVLKQIRELVVLQNTSNKPENTTEGE